MIGKRKRFFLRKKSTSFFQITRVSYTTYSVSFYTVSPKKLGGGESVLRWNLYLLSVHGFYYFIPNLITLFYLSHYKSLQILNYTEMH